MKTSHLAASAIAGLLSFAGATQSRAADIIPYPDVGVYNGATYSFTATTTGDIVAYIVGGFSASYHNTLGLLVNGVSTGITGLGNHTSVLGDSLDLGSVHAGDVLTFVLNNSTLGKTAYSDPTMNVAYDSASDKLGHNHIYSTSYTATTPLFPGVKAGTYVAFEDLPFPKSDFNYNDESFVFTNVTSGVPEASTWAMMLTGLGGLGYALRRPTRVQALV